MEQKNEKKNYRIIFWQLFGIGMIVNIIFIKDEGILSLISLIIYAVWLFFWCKTFNQAWKAVGKKHGWVIGLTAIIPFGALIGITIAYYRLRNTEYWRGKFKSFRLAK
ncbi:MAG: hypothetical protein WCO55_05520 [Candidatus Falkowbacteria bacterium]